MSGDLSRPFNWAPCREASYWGASRDNDIHSRGAAMALIRVRDEILRHASNTLEGEYDYRRGLENAANLITRLLESRP